jgi:hypothetical protein
MATSAERQKLKDEIKAMPVTAAKPIDIPVRVFTQLAANIYERATRDANAIKKYNYDVAKIDRISLLIELLREASATYNDVQFDQPEMQKQFKKLREQAEWLRSEMLSAMDLAFAGDQNLQAKVAKIREGSSAADLIQDMSDAKVICESNAALLKAINFDKTVLDKIPDISTQLSQLLAKATVDKSGQPDLRIERDKIYTVLKDMILELNRYGRHAFRDDQKHAAAYSIAYTPRKTKAAPVAPAA